MKKLFKNIALCIFALALNIDAFAAGERGTADEAVAMVKKAAAYLKANGKEKAFAEFSNPSGQFKDRDLYIFAIDMNGKNGKVLAHGTNAKLIGKDVIDLKDADGKYFVKTYLELANTKGKGWSDYKWTNPVNATVEHKSTYVEKVDDVLIGSGIYK